MPCRWLGCLSALLHSYKGDNLGRCSCLALLHCDRLSEGGGRGAVGSQHCCMWTCCYTRVGVCQSARQAVATACLFDPAA